MTFVEALGAEPFDGQIVDLGSGGGLPGLVVAVEIRAAVVVLVDSSQRSTGFLRWAVDELGLRGSIEVVTARAEEVGRDPLRRAVASAVTARSFASPAVTAECAAPLLATGGRLLVAEPPRPGEGVVPGAPDQTRWPVAGCEMLGLRPESVVETPFHLALLRQIRDCPDRYPRRVGIPAKRPLF